MSCAWVYSTNSQLGTHWEQFQSCLHPCWDTLGSPVLEQEARRDLAAGGKHL